MPSDMHVSVLTPRRLTSREDSALVLSMITQTCPGLLPERYGHTEPLRLVYDRDNLTEFLDHSGRPMFWERRRSGVQGSLFAVPTAIQRIHGSISARVGEGKLDASGLVRFLKIASAGLQADFAYMHPLTAEDVPIGRANSTVSSLDPRHNTYILIVTTHTLRRYIPQLYWATVFGEPYIKHFGKDRLLSSPAYLVKELSNTCIYLQLSESPEDLLTDFEAVDAVRRKIKAHLNRNSFFDPDLPEDHAYNVPEFRFEPAEEYIPRDVRVDPSLLTDVITSAEPVVPRSEDRELASELSVLSDESRRRAREDYGADLDMSLESIERVEGILDALGKPGKKQIDAECRTWGSYIGEVLRRRWGGYWVWDTVSATIPVECLVIGRHRVFPMLKVRKRLRNAASDNVWFYAQALSAMLKD